jgi:hypothetical protein
VVPTSSPGARSGGSSRPSREIGNASLRSIIDKARKLPLASAAILILGFLFQVALRHQAQPYLIDGHQREWFSSETLMQTVSILDLREAPVESLTHIHIQPPGFDLVRAILVHLWPSLDIHAALKQVDRALYFLWSILYGVCGLLMFRWLSGLVGETIAFLASLLFLLHPAALVYSTLLDTTLLSGVLVLWMYYSLWKLRRGYSSIFAITTSSVLLFFFRSVFQLPFLLVMAVSLFLLKVRWRTVVLFLLITGGICGSYVARQYGQFGLLSTSSFSGLNLVRSVGVLTYTWPYEVDPVGELPKTLPNVLARKSKVDGSLNYNNLCYLEFDRQLKSEYKHYLSATPVAVLFGAYYSNLKIYWRPSSSYSVRRNIELLPWKSAYDFIFSGPVLIVLLSLAGVVWLAKGRREKDYACRVGILLPALYVFVISILFEQGENNRFKFFLEPVFFVFMVWQFHGAVVRGCRWVVLRRWLR